MKNNKLLNGGIIKEGIRQTRAVGIAYCGIGVLAALFCSYAYIYEVIETKSAALSTVSVYSGAMQFIASMGVYLVLPILTVMMYNFLNSRSACDYYHSMPVTRLQTVFSFTVAVAFWYFLPNLAVMLIEIITGVACGMSVMWSSLLMHILNLAALYLHVYGILLLSMSLATGILNQVAAAGIIAFMPRILLYILESISENAAPVLMDLGASLGTFGDISFNLLFRNFLFTGSEMFYNDSVASLLYSVALGIIYGGLGVVSYCHRKSEAATSAGANKYVQCGIRVLVSFVICLIPCAEIGMTLIGTHSVNAFFTELSDLIPTLILYYGFALIAYFLYEAITAKKIKGVVTLKGTMGVGLIILVALNLVFTVAPTLIANAALSAEISTDNVASVSLYQDNSYDMEYYMLDINKIRFDDEYIISTLCDSLDENIAKIRNGNYSDFLYSSKMSSIEVTFNMDNGGKLNRRIYLPTNTYQKVYDKIENDEKYLKAARKMPTVEEAQSFFMSGIGLSEKQSKEVYAVLYDELSAMSDNEYSAYISCEVLLDTVGVYGKSDGYSWNAYYPVNILVPKTYAKCIEICNNSEDFKNISFAEAFANCDEAHISVSIIDPNSQGGWESIWYASFTEEEPTEDMLKATEKIQEYWEKPIDTDKPVLMIEYFVESYDKEYDKENAIYYIAGDEYSWASGVRFVVADDELIEFLKEHQIPEDEDIEY